MMKTLVVGISVRAIVESAVRSGYTVAALDAFGDMDLRSLTECHSLQHNFNARFSATSLYRASRQIACDAIAYTSNLENHPGILELIAGNRPIIGNSPKIIKAVRNWAALYARVRQAGFRVPDSIFRGEDRKPDPDRRWLIKPVLSGGGHGIDFFPESDFPRGPYMLQEYIPGKPCSAAFVANGRGCVVVGITEQLIGMRAFGGKGFRYCGSILPLPEMTLAGTGKRIMRQVQRLALFLTQEYGLSGVNGIDFIFDGEQIYLTEVNPRYSASMELIEQAYKLPIFHLHTQAVLQGNLPEFLLETMLRNTAFFGKAILFTERNAIAPDTKEWLDRNVKDVPAPGFKLRRGNPVCTVLASRQTLEETMDELIKGAAILKKEIYG